MADKKITALNDLGTSLAGEDFFHVIDDPAGTPVNKRISTKNIFNNIPAFLGFDSSQYSADMTEAGAISVTHMVTRFVTGGSTYAATLPNGTDGQMKILAFKTDGGGTVNVTPTSSNIAGVSTQIALADAGDALILIYLTDKWYILSNNGGTPS